jgi:homoserine dehydrogenase
LKKRVNIGLLGCGTVGTGVARMLTENLDLIRDRSGIDIVLRRVADLDETRAEGLRLAPGVFTSDAVSVVQDPEIQIIVEMIGGKGVAKDFIQKAMIAGKHVVTANKALLAAHGNELIREAMETGVDLAFEASTGGCMPIVKTLRESMVGNRIHSMIGILNGTCNYILTRIHEDGISFEEALALAQEKGFAEADPTLDIEGFDTAHKLAILSSIAYGMELNLDDIFVEGISRITPLDIRFADEFGYRIKLLAISKNLGDEVEARVHPTMIPIGNMLAGVSGSLNAVTVVGDAVQDILLYGRGAGMMPTATAVVSDIVDIARNIVCGCAGRVPPLSFQMDRIRKIPIKAIEKIDTHYYFRFSAIDQPGVLSSIAGILGNHGISIKSVQQRDRKINGTVPVVMLTHLAREEAVRSALTQIEGLDVVGQKPVLIRIEDESLTD